MAKEEKKTKHETVEEKQAKKAAEDTKSTDKAEAKSSEEKLDNKEALADSEIMDINDAKEEKDTKKITSIPHNKGPKTTEDFIKSQKKRKRRSRLIVLGIIIALFLFLFFFVKKKANEAKDLVMKAQAESFETATVEKKKLYDSKDATGTLYSKEARTLIANLGTSGAKIESVNVEVGDMVTEGDVLVTFSTEDIEKDIANQKSDISDQRKIDALTAANKQREYVNQYTDAANSLSSKAKSVEQRLEALHEACNEYGDAKRERDKINSMSDMEYSQTYGGSKQSALISAENRVANAYARQKEAQLAYDTAVEEQAQTIESTQAKSLSDADSAYEMYQIQAGDSIKKLERQLDKYEDSLDEYVVTASISGIVTDINVFEGNKFSSGNVLTIQDVSTYTAEVLVDEYDISKVKKAYNKALAEGRQLKVVVKTDATEDQEFAGHVTLIAPTSTSTVTGGASSTSSGSSGASSGSSSSVNYKIKVELDETNEDLMVGMSAKVAIIVDESPDNALCIPYNAVEEKEDGKYVVRLMDENGDKSVYGDFDFGGNEKMNNGGNSDRESKGVNGIVVEKDTADNKDDKGDKKSIFSKLMDGKSDEPQVDNTPKYREVEVTKIFETDYYAAVIPVKADELKEGDEVMIISNNADGNDIFAMFGGARRGPEM